MCTPGATLVDTPRRRLARPRARRAVAWVLGAALALATGACGYHQDVPHLPGGAHTLTLQRVANLTDTGELDVRLRVLLQQRFSQQAHVRLEPAHESALGLSIDLSQLTVTRVVDPALTPEPTYSYTLTGQITLADLRTGHKYADHQTIVVSVRRIYPPAQLETPAVRDDGVNAVLDAFAQQVQQQVEDTF